MTSFLILLTELIGLYLLARLTTKKLYQFLLLVTGHRTFAVTLITIILFPGTVIHELSHLFIAEILGVRTGKLTLVPEDIRQEEIQTGSVAVAATDPFRRAIVGLAPFLVGLIALVTISYFLNQQLENSSAGFQLISYHLSLIAIFLFYLLFAVASSVFPSGPDLKGTPALVLTIAFFLVTGYLVGIRIGITGQALDIATSLTNGLINSLKYVLAVDLVILLITNLLLYLTGKITGRKIVS